MPGLPATAAIAPAPTPSLPKGLPLEIEDASPYLRQVSCDPHAQPGTVALGKLLLSTYPGTRYTIERVCDADLSEHYEGRAIDWTVSARDPAGAAKAAALLGWLGAPDAAGHEFANTRRLGIMYVIWNGRIWGSYANAASWRPYSTCATHPEPAWDTTCHRDHVHLSLSWAGARGVTSFWTGKAAPTDYGPCRPADLNWAMPRPAVNPSPCPTYPLVTAPARASSTASALFQFSGAAVGQGSTGPVVRVVQAALGIGVDGQFGPGTASAVSDFRTAHGLSTGTSVDPATWRALLIAATASLPAPAPAPVGATPGRGEPLPAPARPKVAKTSPLTPYTKLVLTPGSRGEAVVALQRALKVTPVSSWFGPVTKTAVIAFQKTHKIQPTGNVGPLTWKALGG